MGQSAVQSAALDSHQPAASEGSVKPRDVPRGHTSALVLGRTSLVGAAAAVHCGGQEGLPPPAQLAGTPLVSPS